VVDRDGSALVNVGVGGRQRSTLYGTGDKLHLFGADEYSNLGERLEQYLVQPG
jgi:hypothetical protein